MIDISPLSPFEVYFSAWSVYALREYDQENMRKMYRTKEYVVQDGKAHFEGVSAPFNAESVNSFTGRSGFNFLPRVFGVLTETSGFGFLAQRGDASRREYVLVTRGTDLTPDWITDAKVGAATGPTGTVVHQGFNDTFSSYQVQLGKLLAQVGPPPATIHCVGHSLGGALANLNAALLNARGYKVYLYTLGCPRVGHYHFATDLENSLAGRIYRVANRFDPVSMIPVFPFLHASTPSDTYIISAGGQMLNFAAHSTDPAKPGYAVCMNDPKLDWNGLSEKPKANLTPFHLGLEAAIDVVGGGVLFSAQVLVLIGQAIQKIASKVTSSAILTLQRVFEGGVTAIDRLAEMITIGAALSKEAAAEAKSIAEAIFRFLGKPLQAIRDVTLELMRWLLSELMYKITGLAKQAISKR